MEYTVAKEVDMDSLISKLNDLIKAGQMPHGGIAIDISQGQFE